jgi:hypothetical protein
LATFRQLACILNVQPKYFPEKERGTTKWLFDYQHILSAYGSIQFNTNDSIQKFVKDSLDWGFFTIDLAQPPYYNMRCLRSFLQLLTPVGISFVEGNHRIVIASKLLYGQALDNPVPFEMQPDFDPVPATSPLYEKVHCNVIFPDKEDAQHDKNGITEQMIEYCQQYSASIAASKKYFIDTSWKDFLETLLANPAFSEHSMLEQDFINLELPKKGGITPKPNAEDTFEKNILKIAEIVANALFDIEPAKRIADQGKRQEFIERAIAPNLTCYRHRVYAKVSKQAIKEKMCTAIFGYFP